jgi:hypothetical protein
MDFLRYHVQNNSSIYRITTESYHTKNSTQIFSHIITISSYKDFYKRSYIKIQGVLAYIGGYVTFFNIFLSYINAYLIYPNFILNLTKIFFTNK